MMLVVVFTDEAGWHGKRLREALAARGAEARFLSLRSCSLGLNTGEGRLDLPGLEGRLPDAAFVRGISGGSLEEVVFRLDLLHALTESGVHVYNDGRAIERSVDKAFTSFVLAREGLPTPETLVTADREQALSHLKKEAAAGRSLVCKPLFGSQGEGVVRVDRPEDLPACDAVNGVWYLQRFLPSAESGAADWRLFIVGGRVVASMLRTSGSWLTNVAQGGSCVAVSPSRSVRRMAQRAVQVLNMGYAGVDLMCDRDGRWWVLEVNSIPAWRGLQGVCGLDIAGVLADDLLHRCRASCPLEAV